jgi:hypothetical protein
LQKVPGVLRVQIVQEELTHVRVLAVGAAGIDWSSARAALGSILRPLVGDEVVIDVAPVDSIAPGPGGKVRAVVRRCDRPGA